MLKHFLLLLGFVFLSPICAMGLDRNAVSQYGITWSFDRSYQVGQFAGGDWWVVGPVVVTSITNDWHAYPGDGFDGSMVNPPTDASHGYDHRLAGYDASLNVQLQLPLTLQPDSSLVSTVSWLEGEEGCPNISGGTHAPRPVLKTGTILTCLSRPPPLNSFRPAYCGSTKKIYQTSQVRKNLLPSLVPVSNTPSLIEVERYFERPWLDHINNYPGSHLHPSENLQEYGRELSIEVGIGALMLLLDENVIGDKATLLNSYVQVGIDLYGILDNGGFWPSNGGINQGRKWPVLFAGLMLNDPAMLAIGQLPINKPGSETGSYPLGQAYFHEDGDTFYVAQEDIDRVHSPDPRSEYIPYRTEDLGMPEWGIRHSSRPEGDNRNYDAIYRANNGQSYVGWCLAARILNQIVAWNHNALFDYVDRWMNEISGDRWQDKTRNVFVMNMWQAYRDTVRIPPASPQNLRVAAGNFYLEK